MLDDVPVATYRERLLQVRRVLELYADHIVIRARWVVGGSYEMTVRLDALRPEPKLMWVRQRLFKRALGIALLLAAAAVVVSRPGYNLSTWIIYAIYALAGVVGVVAVMAFPKVQFARFMTRDNKPALDVFRAGPDASQFDAFLDKIARQVRKG